MSALCRHRGHALAENCQGNKRRFVCPYHHWSYTLTGDLVGAPRMEDAIEVKRLREELQLPLIRTEIWNGFIFVNFDQDAKPLAPSLAKLEPYLAGYDLDNMVTIPPKFDANPVPWNWKILLENYIEPYHTEYVHPGIHDFAPSTGVEFSGWNGDDDNVIVRYVPFLEPDGGLTERGWSTPASFPPIETLSPKQRHRVGFGMIPPSMNIIFTPDMLTYGLIYPLGPKSLTVGGGLFTAGGWCMPKSTVDLPDFDERAARLMEGSRQLGEQDTTVNLAMQRAKSSAYAPRGRLGSAGGNAGAVQSLACRALSRRGGSACRRRPLTAWPPNSEAAPSSQLADSAAGLERPGGGLNAVPVCPDALQARSIHHRPPDRRPDRGAAAGRRHLRRCPRHGRRYRHRAGVLPARRAASPRSGARRDQALASARLHSRRDLHRLSAARARCDQHRCRHRSPRRW